MPTYDSSGFDPPAPVARVMLRDPTSGASLAEVLLLIDTGADITLLPQAAVERLGVKPIGGTNYQLLESGKIHLDFARCRAARDVPAKGRAGGARRRDPC